MTLFLKHHSKFALASHLTLEVTAFQYCITFPSGLYALACRISVLCRFATRAHTGGAAVP